MPEKRLVISQPPTLICAQIATHWKTQCCKICNTNPAYLQRNKRFKSY